MHFSQFRVHLTNVTAPGPVQVVRSLLPYLETNPGAQVEEIYLPNRGELAEYRRLSPGPTPQRYRRWLPAAMSRVLECTTWAHRFDGDTTLLVLGDVPLACNAPQVVFVQTAHLAADFRSPSRRAALKNSLARLLIRLNAPRVSAFIVQTHVMKALLEGTYPHARGKVVVIPQPPPDWLLDVGLRRTARSTTAQDGLDLFYPSDAYAHKNHRLLSAIDPTDAATWPVSRLTLTIPPSRHPNRKVEWIDCVGFLSTAEMLRAYGRTDALIFLSTAESYGLPLVEAMYIGIPIIVPDLPYARALCGEQAIYFAPSDIESLRQAIVELARRLRRGWWPDWSSQMSVIPSSWSAVAEMYVQTVRTAGTAQGA